jgi:hypothetical protein
MCLTYSLAGPQSRLGKFLCEWNFGRDESIKLRAMESIVLLHIQLRILAIGIKKNESTSTYRQSLRNVHCFNDKLVGKEPILVRIEKPRKGLPAILSSRWFQKSYWSGVSKLLVILHTEPENWENRCRAPWSREHWANSIFSVSANGWGSRKKETKCALADRTQKL